MRNFDNKRAGDFRRGGYEKKQFGGRDRDRDRDRERPQMHEAVCSDCGKNCEVPFRPSGDKPVYCNQCFSSHRASSTPNNFEKRGFERPRFQDRDIVVSQPNNQYKEQFEMLNTKLDNIMKALKALTPVSSVKEEKKEMVVEKREEVAKKKEMVVEKKEKAKKGKKK